MRKRGDFAIEIATEMVRAGIQTHLTLLGTKPPRALPAHVTYGGFLDKSQPQDRERFAVLMRAAHYFVLAPVAECTPIAFAEASAFGVPSITGDIGGITSMVRHGRNGWVLPPSASPSDYADTLARNFSGGAAYRALAETSRSEYEDRLNWGTATGRLLAEIARLM
jgi:glycosyltransferase involved in cell wall biosynthesis